MNWDEVRNLIELSRKKGIQIVTAESCTGGLIGGALTEIPGSSDVFWGGFLVYDNDAKIRLLGVSEPVLNDRGAVSEEVVELMLEGALAKSGVDLALAVSGVAGPGGGSPDKPVGTVWIGAALKNGEKLLRKYLFKGDRQVVRLETVRNALLMAEKIILNDSRLDTE